MWSSIKPKPQLSQNENMQITCNIIYLNLKTQEILFVVHNVNYFTLDFYTLWIKL